MTTSTDLKYDVFISYSHKDQDWVRTTLLSTLENNGLKVIIDFRDFRPGAPSLTEMERAVKESRKTILVLTPNYVNSAWAEFEAVIAGTLDPAGRERKIIPILLQKCDIPLRVSYLTYLNFTDSATITHEWKKLLSSFDKILVEVKTTQSNRTQIKGENTIRGIPSKIVNQLRAVLAECDEFSSDTILRSLFNDPKLLPFKSGMREGTSAITRADLLVDFLGNQKLTSGESPLLIFLNILKDRIPNIEEKHKQLKDIISELENPVLAITTSSRSATNDDLMNRIDRLQSDLSAQLKDVKIGLGYIYGKIQSTDSKLIEKILDEVHQGRVEQGEMQRTVESTRRALRHILKAGVKIDDPQISKALTEIYQSVNSSLTMEQKFELTLPVIPYLLDYKINLGAGVDLQAVWKQLRERINNM